MNKKKKVKEKGKELKKAGVYQKSERKNIWTSAFPHDPTMCKTKRQVRLLLTIRSSLYAHNGLDAEVLYLRSLLPISSHACLNVLVKTCHTGWFAAPHTSSNSALLPLQRFNFCRQSISHAPSLFPHPFYFSIDLPIALRATMTKDDRWWTNGNSLILTILSIFV